MLIRQRMTASLGAVIVMTAAPGVGATISYPLSFSAGWSLAGNGLTTPLDVKAAFGSQTGIQTIWKWDAAGSKWAFYAPSLDAAGTLASYAATKGYSVLTTINQGEGFWVNALTPVSLVTQSGTGFTLVAANLLPGWNLVATGDDVAPASFTTSIRNITTLWAWDNATSAWHFYAPSLSANSTLASYIFSKGYKDFGSLTLGKGLGFWVNYAGTASSGTQMGGSIQGAALNLSTVVTSFAGGATPFVGPMDGTGTAAWFFNPTAITTNGTHLYVADTSNNKIRKIEIATGVVTSFAGSGTAGALDGTGTAATFWQPGGIATDGTNLYVTENGNNRVRKIVIATGVVSTLAGSTIGTLDGTGTAAQFSRPIGITTDGTNLYVVDSSSFKIRKIVIDTGVVTTFAGSGSAGAVDAVGTAATFTYPAGITTDGTNLYVADSLSNRIRKIVISTRAVTTLAGSATSGSDDGAGSAAKFFKPAGVATDGTNVYVGDTGNHKIRKIVIATGEVSTIAGTGSIGAADGTGSAASFYNPNGMTTDGKTLYVVDSTNTKIRKID